MAGAPIFILGTERSGSNLLRLILDAHPSITVPHPPHVVRYFAPLQHSYGDLRRDPAFRALAQDVVRLMDTHIYRWEMPIDAERLVREAPTRDVTGLYLALYAQHREAVGKPRWACKSTFMIDHVRDVLDRVPDAKLLFLVRDPRDVALSSKTSVFSTFHPVRTAELWRDQQRTGLHWLDTLPPERIRLVRYETLVAEPEATLRSLCAFLDEPWDSRILFFFERDEARKSASLAESWQNTAYPIRADSVGRWKEALTDADLRAVEAIAREPMARLGYALTHDDAELDAVDLGPVVTARVALEEQLLRLRVEARSLQRDRNVGRRWKRALLLAELQARAAVGRLVPAGG
ncbi:MAG: hypothetical protein RLZZ299_1178 [Pseudomonadota bacterium]